VQDSLYMIFYDGNISYTSSKLEELWPFVYQLQYNLLNMLINTALRKWQQLVIRNESTYMIYIAPKS